MMLSHRQAAVFTARRLELCDVVDGTLFYLRPDSCVHSYLSPLPYEVCAFILIFSWLWDLLYMLYLRIFMFLLESSAVRYASAVRVRLDSRVRSAV